MMPRTHNGLDALEVVSALQKAIRRALEREAMQFACELGHTSKAYFSMLCNRLEIIAHEDVGLGDPQAVLFVTLAVDRARAHYDPERPGHWRLMIGNAIRALCRARKSREGDHYQGAIGDPNLAGEVPVIPDWALDHHTARGRALGRGLEWFRQESAQLRPAPGAADPYEDEFYRVRSRQPMTPRAQMELELGADRR